MALKQAKIFKDFYISANEDNTGIMLSMNSPLEISVKNDNFAQQVQILDNSGTHDLFDYKYITFDGEAIFEITGCIKNGKYTTLFVQYLSNITFDEIDTNFRVDAVSASTLQRLGLDINAFLQILGNNTIIDTEEIFNIDNENQEELIFAIKLRFSQIPQNFRNYFDRDGNIQEGTSTRGNSGNRLYVQSYNEHEQIPTEINQFTQFDNAITAILPIPARQNFYVQWQNVSGGTVSKRCTMSTLLNTLIALITDLTLTAEITILTPKSLFALSLNAQTGGQNLSPLQIATTETTQIITIPNSESATGIPPWGSFLRTVDDTTSLNSNHVCFLTETNFTRVDTQFGYFGFWESYNFFKIYIDEIINTKALLSISVLNNILDISQLRNDYIFVKRQSQSLRVFIDYERNVFEEIQTTFEFAKNAYSNFDAYQKSNIDLTQRQSFAALKQQQEQAREMQTVDTAFSAANGAISAIGSAASGFASGGVIGAIAGGVTSAVSSGLNIAQKEMKFNMQQQNETANAKLAASHQIEKARSTIVPSSELKGSLSFLDAFVSSLLNAGSISLYSLRSISLNALQMACVERYALDGLITDKITNVSQIVKPTWQTLHNYFVVKIENRSLTNNRKSFVILAEIK